MKRIFFLSSLLLFRTTKAIVPDAVIHLDNNKVELGRFANFGSRKATAGTLRLPPSDNPWLCNTTLVANSSSSPYGADSIFLIPRGECSFDLKTRNAQRYGASGIFIYNNLQSRYKWNETARRVEYPVNQQDYECSHGQDEISNFSLDPPRYSSDSHDKLLTLSNEANLCNIDGNDCASKRCLVIGPSQSSLTTACCAWDVSSGMHSDSNLDDSDLPRIFSIFLTMAQADLFLSFPGGLSIRVNERAYPKFNASSFLLWMMATAITAFASWYSAGDYRRAKYKLTHPVPARQTPSAQNVPPEVVTVTVEDRSGEVPLESAVDDDENQLEMIEQGTPQESHTPSVPLHPSAQQVEPSQESAPAESPSEQNPTMNPITTPPMPLSPPTTDPVTRMQTQRARNHLPPTTGNTNTNGSVELTIWHAALFVVIASAMLLLLFFFEFYTAVTVLYGIGCAGAVSQILFRPCYSLIARLLRKESCIQLSTCPRVSFCGLNQTVWLDVISGLSGYTLGGMWLFIWFTSNDPSSIPFYWIAQDVMGACLCILFLSLLKLNSIKVASVLLFAVFVYDIFFVFITPLFLDSSVMITVATGGGGPDVSADYCEKYPDDKDCRSTALPMLLALPKINDFRGGQNLLGLGDIVLPGLLISFAARLDDAKRLIGGHTTLDIKLPTRGGYLLPLIIAYAVGLLFANLAVVWLNGGQPALLYLVPACLGTMIYVGWHELGELWKGPQVLCWADNLVRYCERHTFVAHPSADEATVVDTDSVMDEETPSVRILT